MADLKEGIELLENGEFDEAYECFNQMLDTNPKNLDALYYRAFSDFFHSRKHVLEDYHDFKYLYEKKTKYATIVLPLLVFACDELNIPMEVIKYARKALEIDNPYLNDMKYILIKALCQTAVPAHSIEALNIIDNIIQDEEDDTPLEVYLQKIDVQIKFNDFDGASKTLDDIFTKFPGNANIYFVKGKLFLNLATSKSKTEEETKEYLNDAIRAFEIALQYDTDSTGSRLMLAECYGLMGEINKALTTLDGFKDTLSNDLDEEQRINFEADLVVEKLKICEVAKEWDLGLTICTDFLENHESWKVYYSLGYFQNITAETNDDLLIARKNIKKAYNMQKADYLLSDVVNINIILKNFEENDNLIKQAIKENPKSGLLYYLLAENSARLDEPYDALINYYNEAYKNGYLNDVGLINHTCFLEENPSKNFKKHKKILTNTPKKNVWDFRRIAIRYLYGEYGYKQNIEYANKLLFECNVLEPNEPCILTTLARSEELLGRNESAFDLYKKAYEIYQGSIHSTCNCAVGYLAHCYFNGIGTSKDVEMAKKLILEGINKEHEYSASLIIYHYAYFALLDEEGFDKEIALKYLLSNFAFDRYDIVRYLYVNKLSEKLNKPLVYDNKQIKKCLKELSKDYTKYYKNNINKDIIYPYYKSF